MGLALAATAARRLCRRAVAVEAAPRAGAAAWVLITVHDIL
jgi:hypothetical protein